MRDHDAVSVDRLHLEIEAIRLAYRDRNTVLGDPEFGDIPMNIIRKARCSERPYQSRPAHAGHPAVATTRAQGYRISNRC